MRGEEENEAAPATEAHPPILEDDARAVLRQMNARSLKWKELVEPPPLATTTRERQEHTVHNNMAKCGKTTPTS